jgi:hypothetical protein
MAAKLPPQESPLGAGSCIGMKRVAVRRGIGMKPPVPAAVGAAACGTKKYISLFLPF